jgi:predicted NUDIX family NTP pyrophosphohydrolase
MIPQTTPELGTFGRLSDPARAEGAVAGHGVLRDALHVSKQKTSAGLLPYRFRDGRLEVLIAHMGGPFWAAKDEGAWSIVKGECDAGEDAYAAARREFAEETGKPPPDGEPLELGEVRQRGGKRVVAWAIHGDLDAERVVSNTFTREWPPRSGEMREFPEIDCAQWLDCATARRKLVSAQVAFVDALELGLGERPVDG